MQFALLQAFDHVVAQFAADGIQCANEFGWEKKEKHLTQSRIVWEPGDPSGSIGASGLPISAGNVFPPIMGTFWQTCTLYVTATHDPAQHKNETLAWIRTMTLRNLLITALTKRIPKGAWRVDGETYDTRIANRANVTIISVISFLDDVVDENTGFEEVHPWTAEVELTELDSTEIFEVPAP